MLNFGEKAALDAYADFCKLQQGLIGQLNTLVNTLAQAKYAFTPPSAPLTEHEEDLKYLKDRMPEPISSEIEDLLKETGFHNPAIEGF